eukprot:CAMPEP_0115386372 /NCGR_PEP_ID=MMETSP0271-20121206/8108_1 /TAXON_ID=71861 /ORGANISM="Scrippsiella trochoidea, Strain CCMP3099" /LENGTH=55 /DNA_ID=CAMNT_0002809793 /DNA_START=446 /DNA_END=613 /DNA_ORIENTATION=-
MRLMQKLLVASEQGDPHYANDDVSCEAPTEQSQNALAIIWEVTVDALDKDPSGDL